MAQQVLWTEPVELAMPSKSLQNYPHNQILQTSLSLNIIIFDTYFSQGYKLLTIYFERLETYESWDLQRTNLEIENMLQYHGVNAQSTQTFLASIYNSSVNLFVIIWNSSINQVGKLFMLDHVTSKHLTSSVQLLW